MPVRIKSNRRIQGHEIKHLDTGDERGGGLKSCFLPLLIFLIVAGAIGTFFYLNRDRYFGKEEPEQEETPPPKPKPVEKPAEPPPPPPEEPPEPPPPPKKTVAQLKAEADAAQKDLDVKIAEARKKNVGKELPGFAGAKFGEQVKGAPISVVKLPGAEDVTAAGFGYSMRGPVLKSAFRSFGKQPTVWVTPKTRQIFRIEFSRDLDRTPGTMPDPDTTNLVSVLAKKLRRDPFALDPEQYPLARREYVFPMGATTLTVSEEGGGIQKLVAINEGMFDQVRAESAELRADELKKTVKDKILGSDKYPSSGKVKTKTIRMKKGTIRSFCGLSFGALAPYGAKVSRPPKGVCAFFIDYRMAKLRPFMNFEHGRAEIGRSNGAICAVELYSEGASDGLTDAEYFEKVRKTLESHYEVKPQETPTAGKFPKLVYALGDVDLTLAPDENGGFRLRAENTVLKALW